MGSENKGVVGERDRRLIKISHCWWMYKNWNFALKCKLIAGRERRKKAITMMMTWKKKKRNIIYCHHRTVNQE